MNDSPATYYEKREVNDCGEVNEMAEQYADTIALQKPYGKKQYCKGAGNVLLKGIKPKGAMSKQAPKISAQSLRTPVNPLRVSHFKR